VGALELVAFVEAVEEYGTRYIEALQLLVFDGFAAIAVDDGAVAQEERELNAWRYIEKV
jgi:hypothetical protein